MPEESGTATPLLKSTSPEAPSSMAISCEIIQRCLHSVASYTAYTEPLPLFIGINQNGWYEI